MRLLGWGYGLVIECLPLMMRPWVQNPAHSHGHTRTQIINASLKWNYYFPAFYTHFSPFLLNCLGTYLFSILSNLCFMRKLYKNALTWLVFSIHFINILPAMCTSIIPVLRSGGGKIGSSRPTRLCSRPCLRECNASVHLRLWESVEALTCSTSEIVLSLWAWIEAYFFVIFKFSLCVTFSGNHELCDMETKHISCKSSDWDWMQSGFTEITIHYYKCFEGTDFRQRSMGYWWTGRK